MATLRATLIPGDGAGPEVVAAARRVVDATGVEIAWEVEEAGRTAAERAGTPLPARVLKSIRRTGVALKGPLEPSPGGSWSPDVRLRIDLELFACVRPCRTYPGAPSRYAAVDLVIVRENTEDAYTGIEFEQGSPATAELIGLIERGTGRHVREDSGLSVKAISEGASERIVRFAFGYVRANGRHRLTAGHKANIMKFSDGLFLETARRVAADHPDVPFDDRIIDNLTMQLVARPEDYDVLVLPNQYGDILSDLCAGLVGGFGLAPGMHVGDRCAVFEATPGAPPPPGPDRANPMALMLSGAMLLRHLGARGAGDRLEAAVASAVAAGEVTADLAPPGASALGTRAVTAAVLERLG